MGDSSVVAREPCPKCGSRDNLARYDDGHAYCFGMGCGYYEPATGKGQMTERKAKSKALVPADEITITNIEQRKLTAETCKKFGYGYTTFNGKKAHVAPYYDAKGRLVAQKIRMPGKEFCFVGNPKEATLFGQNVWRSGGRRLVITEGEIDALSMSQALGNKWPVVSVPNGAQGAAKSIRANIEYVESFDEVVLMFDMDEPGQMAAREVAELLIPGKAKIAHLPEKDANECLKKGKVKELVQAMWEAKTTRPDGIVCGTDLWGQITKPLELGIPYPWENLNAKTYGLRKREIVTLSAGSGIGKSAVSAEIAYHLVITHGQKVGYIALEESVGRSGKRFLSIHLNTPIHLPGHEVAQEELRKAFDETLGTGRVFFFDHFGSLDSENLLSKMRYLVKACGCDWIVLDHLSIVVSGMDLGEDERRAIDKTMTELRSFVEETGCGMVLVSHLKRPEGKGHEEGAKTSLAQLRGSAAIAQLSDMVLGLERNQQAETPEDRNTTVVRVLKNRYSGDTGVAAALLYDPHTGRLSERGFVESEDGIEFEPMEGSAEDVEGSL